MSTNFTLDDLAALEQAIAKGVKTVKYTDRELTYRSIDEMLKVRDLIRDCLGLNGEGRGRRRLATHNKGL